MANNPRCPLCRGALTPAALTAGVTAAEAAAAAAPKDEEVGGDLSGQLAGARGLVAPGPRPGPVLDCPRQ